MKIKSEDFPNGYGYVRTDLELLSKINQFVKEIDVFIEENQKTIFDRFVEIKKVKTIFGREKEERHFNEQKLKDSLPSGVYFSSMNHRLTENKMYSQAKDLIVLMLNSEDLYISTELMYAYNYFKQLPEVKSLSNYYNDPVHYDN